MFECDDDCVEDDQETHGFCPKHEVLARELEEIIDGGRDANRNRPRVPDLRKK